MRAEIGQKKTTFDAVIGGTAVLRNKDILDPLPTKLLIPEAADLNPAPPETHFRLGLIASGGNDHANAIEEFKHAIERDSKSSQYHFLLGREYAADPTLLADLVREALDAVGSGSREMELRLHPDDFGVLAPHLAGLDGVRLTMDTALARGELRLHSEGVRIDGTLAARLHTVLESTLASRAENAA